MKNLIGIISLIIGVVGLFILVTIAVYLEFGLIGAAIAFCVVSFFVGASLYDDNE